MYSQVLQDRPDLELPTIVLCIRYLDGFIVGGDKILLLMTVLEMSASNLPIELCFCKWTT